MQDEPVLTITLLASIAALFGDHDAVRTHVMGLELIVKLKTGGKGTRIQPKLSVKIDQ